LCIPNTQNRYILCIFKANIYIACLPNITMLSRENLKAILSEQRADLLKRDGGTLREELAVVEKKIHLPHVLVITGIRRCGKSTLLRQIIKKDYQDEEFYYITFEDERLLGFKASEFSQIYDALLDLYGEKKAFFLDEVQNIPGFDTFVRRFSDNGFKFFVTGSNARLLSHEISTRLTGRHLDVRLRPFSFSEFLELKGFENTKASAYKPASRSRLRALFDEYLEHGGMPDYAKSHDRQILKQAYEDIVLKDIVVRRRISNEMQLRELYRYVITNFANKYSYHSLAKTLGIKSVHSVKNYLGFLEEAYFMRQVCKFDYSYSKQIANERKPYICDNGFVTTLSARPMPDRGWLLENLVFGVLEPQGEVFYGSHGGQECDFLLVQGRRVKMAVQVAWELHEKNRKHEFGGLCKAMKAHKLKEGLLLTYEQEGERKTPEGKVIIKPVWKWLLEGKTR